MERKLIEGEIEVGNTGHFFLDLLPDEPDLYEFNDDLILSEAEQHIAEISTVIDDAKQPQVAKSFVVPRDGAIVNRTAIGTIKINGGSHFVKNGKYSDYVQKPNYNVLSSQHVNFDKPLKDYDINLLIAQHNFLSKFPVEQLTFVFNYITQELEESVGELIDRGELTKDNFNNWIQLATDSKEQLEERQATQTLFNNLSSDMQNSVVSQIQISTNLSREEILNEIGYAVTMEDINSALRQLRA